MMRLLSRAKNRVARTVYRAEKIIRQRLQPAEHTYPAFVLGVQRSGTNMLLKVLDQSPQTLVYNEDHRRVFTRSYRLHSLDTVERIRRTAKSRVVVFKPILELQLADQFLNNWLDTRIIWIFRQYEDVGNSAMRRWVKTQRNHIKRLATTPDTNHWFVERVPADVQELVASYYEPEMDFADAAALKWYVRNKWFFLNNLDHHPDRVMLINYQDFVENPVHMGQRMFDFLDLEFKPQYVDDVHASSVNKHPFPAINPEIAALCNELYDQLCQHRVRIDPL